MAGYGDAIGNITNWVQKFFNRKDAKDEKDAGKAVMSGDESSFNNVLRRLYPKKRDKK